MSEKVEKHELLSVRGIGPATLQKLLDHGIDTVEKLIISKPEEIATALGVSLAKAKALQNEAKSVALAKVVEVWTGERMREHMEKEVARIPTGIDGFDRILGGGLPTGALVAFSGASATGKTEICYSVCVNCLKYLKRPFVWIETEPYTFSVARLLEIAKNRGVEVDLKSDFYVVPAKDVASNPDRLMLAYERVQAEVDRMTVKPAVLVIDSFSSPFRQAFFGREMLSARSQETARHIGWLQAFSAKYNVLVLLTEQVYAIPDMGQQFQAVARFGDSRRPYGGEAFLHMVSMHLTLIRSKGDEWLLVTDDVPGIPMTEFKFKITDSGVVGSE
jgi:RecA/RadA recombinase